MFDQFLKVSKPLLDWLNRKNFQSLIHAFSCGYFSMDPTRSILSCESLSPTNNQQTTISGKTRFYFRREGCGFLDLKNPGRPFYYFTLITVCEMAEFLKGVI
jgi:hypothetical protein